MADVNNEQQRLASLSISDAFTDNIFDKIRKTNATSSSERLKECFDTFDKDGDGKLNREEFSHLLRCVFSDHGVPHTLEKKQEEDIFKLLNENQNGLIDQEEFKICWYHWLKQILDPVSALVIVDVQNDFISGSLAVRNCPAGHNGEEVVPIINEMLTNAKFDLIVYSADWHPASHISFVENVRNRKLHHTSKVSAEKAQPREEVVFAGPPITEQKLWPSHCVQDTWGAELHKELKILSNAIHVKKGTNPDIDSYSAFWDNKKMSQTPLVSELTSRGVTDVYVCGIAYDICVGATSLHSIEHGFRTVLVEDACRGVDLCEIDATRDKLKRQGAAIVDASRVPDMVACDDRRPELGYQAALNVAMARRLVKEDSQRKD